jgi:hypothetical protein
MLRIFDGHCAGAIVKYRYPECEMIWINYGDNFDWEMFKPNQVKCDWCGKLVEVFWMCDENENNLCESCFTNSVCREEHGEGCPTLVCPVVEEVYMVDFTLQPFDQMETLNTMCHLHWIDHHKTEVEEAQKRGFLASGGQLLEIGKAACELTWEYLFPDKIWIPSAIFHLGRYDVWDHSHPATLKFQYGFRQFENTYPDNQELWSKFFQPNDLIEPIISKGETLLDYEASQNAKFCKAYAFETELRLIETVRAYADTELPTRQKLFRAICANRGFTNSKLFDSVYDPAKHDLMITFVRKGPTFTDCIMGAEKCHKTYGKWTVSLYSTKSDIDCGAIARAFGGAGRKEEAEFQCEQLPFDY